MWQVKHAARTHGVFGTEGAAGKQRGCVADMVVGSHQLSPVLPCWSRSSCEVGRPGKVNERSGGASFLQLPPRGGAGRKAQLEGLWRALQELLVDEGVRQGR